MTEVSESIHGWLCTSDAKLAHFGESLTDVNVEQFLERLLWDSCSSFVNGPLQHIRYSDSKVGNIIQYFSYPFYSHFKSIQRHPFPWIRRFPLFVGNEVAVARETLARYATLYRGLLEHQTGFSFSGFAGNPSWSQKGPPRFVLMNLDEGIDAEPPEATMTLDDGVLFISARFPKISGPSLGHAGKIRRVTQESTKLLPLLSGGFSPEGANEFWQWFTDVTSSKACLDSLNEIIDAASVHEHQCAAQVHAALAKIQGQLQRDVATATSLTRFMVWNLALGFKRILYIPYRTVEPSDAAVPGVISWAGVILSLDNSISLSPDIIAFLRTTAESDSPVATAPPQLAPLIAGMKLLVEVATSRASISDWKYFQRVFERQSLQNEHAEAIRAGFEHEIRTLHTTVAAAIPEGDLTRAIIDDLDASREIATLLIRAYTERELSIGMADATREICRILSWSDYQLRFDPATPRRGVQIPVPLLFVISELGRNAYKFSSRAGNPRVKSAEVRFTFESDHVSSITVINKSKKKIALKVFAHSPNSPSPKYHGQDLVANIVHELLAGAFTFEARDGLATAQVVIGRSIRRLPIV